MNSFLTHFVLHRHGGRRSHLCRGTVTTAVTTASGCSWTAVSNASWITVTSGSGTAGGTASYTVAVNKPKHVRTGTVTIAGRTVTITQLGNPPGKPINVTIMVD